MISYQNDPSARLLKTYFPPFKGTWKTLPSHLLPDDVLQDSMNVTLLSGKLRSRLGLLEFDTADFNTNIVGSFLFIDVGNSKFPIASTSTKLYKYDGGWMEMTGGLALMPATQVKMASIQIGNSVYLLYANGTDTVKFSNNGAILQNITPYIDPVTGASTIPILKDICTSFNRIVGFSPPYVVTWCSALTSSYLNFTNWPASNQTVLSDTEDSIVAIATLGTLNLAIYKEGNIFVGLAQAGSDSQAFRFEHRGQYEGPAGVQAVVKALGGHVYMTPTGRIGYFDGTQQQWLADGLWPFLQDDIDLTYAENIFGVYNYKTSEIYFWYPKVGDSGLLKGMVTLNTIYPTAGITTVSYFLGETAFHCSNGLSVPLFNASKNPLVFGNPTFPVNTHKTFSLDKDTYTDNNVSFQCSMKTGLFKPAPLAAISQGFTQSKDNSDIYRPIIELYVERNVSKGLVTVSPLTSNSLENDGDLGDFEVIDLTKMVPNEFIGSNNSGSFLGLNLSWDSLALVSYKGCDIYGRAAN